MKRIIFALMLFMPIMAFSQIKADSTKLTTPPANHPLTLGSLYMNGANASNGIVGFQDPTTGKWFTLITGQQASRYLTNFLPLTGGTLTGDVIITSPNTLHIPGASGDHVLADLASDGGIGRSDNLFARGGGSGLGIGAGTNNQNPSIFLEVVPGTPQGVELPQMTISDRLSIDLNPSGFTTANQDGLLVYQNNATKGFYTNILGTGWVRLLTTVDSTTLSGGGGGGMTNPMTTLHDIIVGGSSGTPTRLGIGTTGQVLTYDGTNIIWQTPSGSGSGTTTNALTNDYGISTFSFNGGTSGIKVKADSTTLKSKVSALADYNILITALAGKQTSGTYLTPTSTNTVTNKDLTSGTNTFPTFNQNTTGSAGSVANSLTNGVGITTLTYNGSAAKTVVIDTSIIAPKAYVNNFELKSDTTTFFKKNGGYLLGNLHMKANTIDFNDFGLITTISLGGINFMDSSTGDNLNINPDNFTLFNTSLSSSSLTVSNTTPKITVERSSNAYSLVFPTTGLPSSGSALLAANKSDSLAYIGDLTKGNYNLYGRSLTLRTTGTGVSGDSVLVKHNGLIKTVTQASIGGGGGGSTLTLGRGLTGTSYNGSTAITATVDTTTITDLGHFNGKIGTTVATALAAKQGSLTLTTTGSSGAATLSGNTLNIPQYTGGGGSGVTSIGATVTNSNGIIITGTSPITSSGSFGFQVDSSKYQTLAAKGQANGYTPLKSTRKVDSLYLPDFYTSARFIHTGTNNNTDIFDLATVPVAFGGSGAVTLTGLLKGNGTSPFTAATAGTDYVAPTTTVAGFALSGNVTLANLTATNSTLTFSGTYTGATARTIGLNLATANTWTGLPTFNAGISVGLAQKIGIVEGTGGRSGQTTLVAGTKAITITGLTTSSRAILTFVSIGGTVSTTWQYAAVCTSNTLTITALTNANTTDTTDTSVLTYLIVN